MALPVCCGVGTRDGGSRGIGKPWGWRSLGGLQGQAAEGQRTLGALGEMV